MDYLTFETKVSERSGLPPEQAAAVIRATLVTLAERITKGEANDLAAQLPKQLKEWLHKKSEPTAESFGLEEFLRRVAARAGLPGGQARQGARAVFSTLHEAVTGGEFRDVMSQLPNEFSGLLDH